MIEKKIDDNYYIVYPCIKIIENKVYLSHPHPLDASVWEFEDMGNLENVYVNCGGEHKLANARDILDALSISFEVREQIINKLSERYENPMESEVRELKQAFGKFKENTRENFKILEDAANHSMKRTGESNISELLTKVKKATFEN